MLLTGLLRIKQEQFRLLMQWFRSKEITVKVQAKKTNRNCVQQRRGKNSK